jgi:hypothetical protein
MGDQRSTVPGLPTTRAKLFRLSYLRAFRYVREMPRPEESLGEDDCRAEHNDDSLERCAVANLITRHDQQDEDKISQPT